MDVKHLINKKKFNQTNSIHEGLFINFILIIQIEIVRESFKKSAEFSILEWGGWV